MNLLMIDDEDDIRTVARVALETVGQMEVTDCSSAKEGFEALEKSKPDVILLDYMMPEIDGPGALKHIREMPGCESIPVIFLTARAQKDELEEYKKLGVKGTITKPFDPMELAEQVKALLG
jgi:two-component system OmpR family response regulator